MPAVDGAVTAVAFGLVAVAESTLPLVVFGVVAIAVLVGFGIFASNTGRGGSVYDEIGRGGLFGEDAPGARDGAGDPPPPSFAAADAERELEVRQLLAAHSERRVRRGEPALDIDAETDRLLTPPEHSRGADPSLLEETRQLVIARNERRARKGLEPIDVEAEVRRTLDELGA
jgi:hypothetical protein